jgi:hypothetical protein
MMYLTEFGVRVELVPDQISPLRDHVVVRRLEDGKTLSVDYRTLIQFPETDDVKTPEITYAKWKGGENNGGEENQSSE